MRPDARFIGLDKAFWAHVRTISEKAGYTSRKTRQVKTHSPAEIAATLGALNMDKAHILSGGNATDFGRLLSEYFDYRAEVLNTYVAPRLMRVTEAQALFESLRASLKPSCPLPNNKQKGEKSGPAYLTGIVNMLVEVKALGAPVVYDPMQLTTITRNGVPLRTLSRRVDGCFPGPVNPIAVWEIKEYYYTTTFGSRIADGIYETLLDGLELEEARAGAAADHIEHLLIVDAYETWWEMGRSYLCRIIDLLHMGYVDEVLFGKEVVERLPSRVTEWLQRYLEREKAP